MPELRKDPVIGRWVIISTERGKRPMDFPLRIPQQKGGFCPFCLGNEEKTPPEILAFRADGAGSPWRLRVVPNKFPALIIEGELQRKGIGIYDMVTGVGAHEVVIETPVHERRLSDFNRAELDEVLLAYQMRCRDLMRDERFRYILVFKNHGADAGASLEHSHTQLIATPIVPKRVIEELEGAERHFEIKERCVFCDIIDQELADQRRLIDQNEGFIAIAPFAARFPFETWILPRRHEQHYYRIPDAERAQFAGILRAVLRRINRGLDDPPYNFVIHTAPINHARDWHFHWHLELMPKLTRVAGFEWGSGFYINPTPPEDAAAFLRSLEPDSPAAGG